MDQTRTEMYTTTTTSLVCLHNTESRMDTQTALTAERLIDKDSLKLLTQSEKRHIPTGKQSGEGEGLRDAESFAL